MKKTITKTMLFVMIAAISLFMVASIAKAAVKDTKHNLSTSASTGNTFKLTAGTDEVCVFCHTPHFSATSAPLWNRTASSATYTMYTSITKDMTTASTPQGVSAACLSCHDGTVAFDALLNKPGSGSGAPSGWTWNGGNANISTSANAALSANLTNDHPISITYDITKDTAFNAATSGKVGTLPLYGASKDQVECSSCHDVHGGAAVPFLRLANTGSALCLACHVK